jgi:peroxiredoxin Q/BCP
MSELNVGQAAPDFTLPTDGGGEISLSKLKGQKVVVYFYPKDDTPGCTAESCGFRDAMPDFKTLNAQIIGVSKCSVKKHDAFKAKYELNFPLASDENGNVCEMYGVWAEKSMYGKKYMGIERSTFLIDEQGKIAAIWRKVSVTGHVEEVAAAIQGLAKAA